MNQLAFKKWFDKMAEAEGIKNFSASEFTNYFVRVRNGGRNSIPSERIWNNIVPALRIVQRLRMEFGQPITILSSYRSPTYNLAIGGAKFSQHKNFCALDIVVKGVSPEDVDAKLKHWRDCGCFVGGIGLYVTSGFVHIDTRGENATWQGN